MLNIDLSYEDYNQKSYAVRGDKQKYEKIIKSVNGKMNHGRDPIEVANLVLKIIKEKKPKINYLVGGFLEKKITLKSLFPDKIFQKIIMKLYS